MNSQESSEEENLTTEERIRWLRERGIQVQIPGEKIDEANLNKFHLKVVKIPADDKEALEEVTLDAVAGRPGDQCLELLRSFFKDSSSTHDLDPVLLNDVKKSMGEVNIKPSTIEAQLSLGGVESFILLHPCQDNHFTRISAYLDEAGQLKHLPTNPRARSFAALCGYDNVTFYGDIYIGKYIVGGNGIIGDGKGPIRNIDFLLEETATTSKWIQEAKRINYKHAIRTNQVSMSHDDIPGIESGIEQDVKSHDGQVGYKWSQSSKSVEVSIILPKETVAKDIQVTFKPDHLSVSHKVLGTPFLNTTLHRRIVPSECTWSFSQGNLDIYMEKSDEYHWPRLEA